MKKKAFTHKLMYELTWSKMCCRDLSCSDYTHLEKHLHSFRKWEFDVANQINPFKSQHFHRQIKIKKKKNLNESTSTNKNISVICHVREKKNQLVNSAKCSEERFHQKDELDDPTLHFISGHSEPELLPKKYQRNVMKSEQWKAE